MAIFRPTITFHKPHPVLDKEFVAVLDSGVTSKDVTLAGNALPIVKELEFKFESVDVNPSSQILEYLNYTQIYDLLEKASKGNAVFRLDSEVKSHTELKLREGEPNVFKNTLDLNIPLEDNDEILFTKLEFSTTGTWPTEQDNLEESKWHREDDYSCYIQPKPLINMYPKDLELPYNTKDYVYFRYTYNVWYLDSKSKSLRFKANYKSKTFKLLIKTNPIVNELQARLAEFDTSNIKELDYSYNVKVYQDFNLNDNIQAEGEEGNYTINLNFKLELNSKEVIDLFLSNLEGISITTEDPTILVSKDNNNLVINSTDNSIEINNVILTTVSIKKEINLNIGYKSNSNNDGNIKLTIKPSYRSNKPIEVLELDSNNLLHGSEEYLKLRDDIAEAYIGFRNVFYYTDIPTKTVRSTWEVLDNGKVIYTIDNNLIPSTLGIFTFNSFRKGSTINHKDLEILAKWHNLFPNVKLSKEELTEDEIEEYLSSEVYTGLPYGKGIFNKDNYTMRVTFYNKDNEPLGKVEKEFTILNRYLKAHTNRTDLYSLNCYKLPFLTKDKYFRYYKKHQDYKCCKPVNFLLSKSQPLYHEESYVANIAFALHDKDPENIANLYDASPMDFIQGTNNSNRTFTIFKDIRHLAELIHSMSYFEDPALGEIRRPIAIQIGLEDTYFKPTYVSKVTDTVESVKEELIRLGVLETIKNPNLDNINRLITVSVYPSEKVVSYPLYMETIPYVLEEELSNSKPSYIPVEGDTKELKLFKDNFDFLGLVPLNECTDKSLTGFKGVFTQGTLYYRGQEVIHPENYALYLCIKDTEEDTKLSDSKYFLKVSDNKSISPLPEELNKYYGQQVPTLMALASYFNLINTKNIILSNYKNYSLEEHLEFYKVNYARSKLGDKLLMEGFLEHYCNILGYWFKLKNLNNHKTILYSSRPLFWSKDKDTVVKLGITHPKNNLIRVGLKYYYVRLVTDVYNPEDDCCVESNVLSGIPNNDVDFTSFNDPSLVNNRESIITYDILKTLIDNTELEDKAKTTLKDRFDVLRTLSTKTNLVYSALPKDRKGNRYLDQEDTLAYNIHMEEELYYGGELSEELFGTYLEKTYDKSNIEDSPYKDYYPIHIVLEEVDERELPIYNLKQEIKHLASEININVDTLKSIAKDKYIPELNGYDVSKHSLIPSIDPVTQDVIIPTIHHGGYVNNINLYLDTESNIKRTTSVSNLNIPSYDRWSMTGYLGILPITKDNYNPIFSQLEKIAKHRLKNNDVVRCEENDKLPIVHVFYSKGKLYLIPTDQPYLTKDTYLTYGRSKPIDMFSKDVERIKLGTLIFDVELQYLLNNKGG